MTKRRAFSVSQVPRSFWGRNDVQTMLAGRDVGSLFRLYLSEFPDCTQTQLALMTQHDRSEISNFVRGVRSPYVADIDVLVRIADGMCFPDESRRLLGLAPANARVSRASDTDPESRFGPMVPEVGVVTGWSSVVTRDPVTRVALCGSRARGTVQSIIDETVHALARWLMTRRLCVIHGPVGIGIEILTFVADHYHPENLDVIVGVLGRHNIVSTAQYILVLGGGSGTRDEVDMALSLRLKVIPFPASGGTAAHAYTVMRENPRLHKWLGSNLFAALRECEDAQNYVHIVEQALALGHEEINA